MNALMAWLGSEQVRRAARTAWQTFVGVAALAAFNVLVAYGTGGNLDVDAFWRQGIVLGVAAVVALYMNRPK